jgi:hypothetical protein
MKTKRKFIAGFIFVTMFLTSMFGTGITALALTKNIAQCKIEGIADKTYTGGKITLDLKLTYGGVELQKGQAYKTAYASNTQIGTAKVKITGIGDFTGEIIKEFNITPPAPNIVSIFTDENNNTVVTAEKIDNAVKYTLAYRIKGDDKAKSLVSQDNLFTLKLNLGQTYQFIVKVTVKKGDKLLAGDYSKIFTKKITDSLTPPEWLKYPDLFLGSWSAVTYVDPDTGEEKPAEKIKLKAFYTFGNDNIIRYSFDNGSGMKKFEFNSNEYKSMIKENLFTLQVKDDTGLEIPFIYVQNGYLYDYDGSGVVKFKKDDVS